MADIKTINVDVDKLREYASEIKELGDKLNTARTALNEAMDGVREGWEGTGADRFHELLSDDWSVAVTRYCELIDLLVDIMNEAATTYENMETDIKSIKYHG